MCVCTTLQHQRPLAAFFPLLRLTLAVPPDDVLMSQKKGGVSMHT